MFTLMSSKERKWKYMIQEHEQPSPNNPYRPYDQQLFISMSVFDDAINRERQNGHNKIFGGPDRGRQQDLQMISYDEEAERRRLDAYTKEQWEWFRKVSKIVVRLASTNPDGQTGTTQPRSTMDEIYAMLDSALNRNSQEQ